MINYRDENQKEILHYGAKVMISEFSKTIIILCVAYVFGYMQETLTVMLSIVTLRRYTGGLHFNNYWSCFSYTSMVFLFIITVSKLMYFSDFMIAITAVLSIVVIYKIAPIVSPKRVKYGGKKNSLFKKKATIIVVVQALLCLVVDKDISKIIIISVIYQITEVLCCFLLTRRKKRCQF